MPAEGDSLPKLSFHTADCSIAQTVTWERYAPAPSAVLYHRTSHAPPFLHGWSLLPRPLTHPQKQGSDCTNVAHAAGIKK